jgi:hypothetical protein
MIGAVLVFSVFSVVVDDQFREFAGHDTADEPLS